MSPVHPRGHTPDPTDSPLPGTSENPGPPGSAGAPDAVDDATASATAAAAADVPTSAGDASVPGTSGTARTRTERSTPTPDDPVAPAVAPAPGAAGAGDVRGIPAVPGSAGDSDVTRIPGSAADSHGSVPATAPAGGPGAPGGPGSVGGAALLAGGVDGPEALAPLLAQVLGALRVGAEARGGPLPGGGPEGVAGALRDLLAPGSLLPETGEQDALWELTRALAATAADPADPLCAAHLHVPSLAVAAAADLAVAALNPSLDSWDQAPGGTEIETAVLRLLAGAVGFARPEEARGVFTTGGTESNLMALLLARDAVLAREFGVQGGGAIPAEAAGRLRVFCSAAAHFSLARAAAVLGLGAHAVVPIETGEDGTLDPRLLDWGLADARTAGSIPCCVVATAGTTDRGAVDPLRSIAAVARRHAVPFHVDAAYGGGALFSDRLAPLLDGLGLADTVGLDLHKLGWQPVAAGVLLAADAATLGPLEQRVAYLNPADDEEAGYTSLLGRSLRTTRRPDAFKVAVTLRTLGRSGLGALVDRCHELVHHAARAIAAEPRLELVADPVLTTVLFRYLPDLAAVPALPEAPAEAGDDPAMALSNEVNAELRRLLLADGTAVVGRTELPGPGGGVRLKLTLLNPHTTEADLDRLLALVVAAGAAVEREWAGRAGPAPHRPSTTQEKPA
ncbi:L-2,4-diaminobutyrate decarboxylase [Streptacidiphilus sp. MAP12-33]|uniref:pyridoxal phosphate-dependent decarboxylase family protein n=1 Tax=Streptacidiphilus sp. MAP12-33 TaxID=3156266 RepID=UPI003511F572